jgi:hypothetical protein
MIKKDFPNSKECVDAIVEALADPGPSKVKNAILRYAFATETRESDTSKKYRRRKRKARKKLYGAMSEVVDPSILNFGYGLMKKIRVLVIKHFAPMECIDYKDPLGFLANKIDSNNICIGQYNKILPKSIVEEAGGEWTEEMDDFVFERLAFTDMSVIIAYDKHDPEPEFQIAADKMGISLELLFCVGFFFMRAQAYHYRLCHQDSPNRGPLPIICASRPAHKFLFGGIARCESDVILAEYSMHGQVAAMGEKALGNFNVWSNKKLSDISRYLAFVYFILMYPKLSEEVRDQWPEVTNVVMQLAGRAEKTPEMIEAQTALMRRQLSINGKKGGKIVQDACKAFWLNKDMTEEMNDIVVAIFSGGEKGGDVVKQAFLRMQLRMPLRKKTPKDHCQLPNAPY